MHWQLYVSALTRIADEKCQAYRNQDSDLSDTKPQKYVPVPENSSDLSQLQLTMSDLLTYTCIQICGVHS